MTTVLLIVHLLVTLALIGVVLIQRSEGGGLGIGSSQGMGAFMSGRGTANLLTRATGVLAALFMLLSLSLALLNRGTSVGRSILDIPPPPASTQPSSTQPSPTQSSPTQPSSTQPSSTEPAPARPAPAAPAAPPVPTN